MFLVNFPGLALLLLRVLCQCEECRIHARVRLAVELCATYWHYLLGVWVVLYALIVSNELGLAICSSTPL